MDRGTSGCCPRRHIDRQTDRHADRRTDTLAHKQTDIRYHREIETRRDFIWGGLREAFAS